MWKIYFLINEKMRIYLSKVFLLLIFFIFVWYNYYFVYSWHITNFNGYFGYFLALILIYWVYKYITSNSKWNDYKISLKTIILLFLSNLFILCFYFFSITWDEAVYWFSLFFKILFFAIFPTIIFILSTAFWKFLTKKLEGKKELLQDTHWLLELCIWFISLISLLTIFWIFGLYNIYAFVIIFLVFVSLSYKEILDIFKTLWEKDFKIPKDDLWEWKLVLTEFFYLVAFIVLWVWLISVFRPYPIWWDDLWVYMNFPHLMAENSSLLSLWWMYSWQVFTGIWYMFGSPTLAFFLNFSSIFLSFLVLNTVLSNFLSIDKERKSLLNLPIILSTIFIGLPMVWFHTKDMKLDEWLFFISVIALFLLYKFYLSIKEDKNFSILYLFLVWIIVWFSFWIKFTSLLLIVWILWVISFARLWIIGFLGYVAVFFWVFTLGNFWEMMNIVINPNNIVWFEKYFWIWTLVVWFLFLGFSIIKNNKKFILYIKEISIFLLWVIIVLLPWFGKNIVEIAPNFSISWLLYWNPTGFNVDYTKLYSQEEYDTITKEKEQERKKENSITTNEDFLRYFGYEKWILDYVNMFWNLTMQKNQAGEYTNIWFLFLVFLPLIFVFLPFRKKYYFIFFVFIALVQLLFYAIPNSKLIDVWDLTEISDEALKWVVSENGRVFQNKKFNKDIYDIKISDEYWLALFTSLEENPIIIEEAKTLASNSGSSNYVPYVEEIVDSMIQEQWWAIVDTFYADLVEKVKNPDLWPDLNNFPPLNNSDFDYIKYLNYLYSGNKIFISSDFVSFTELLNEKWISWSDRDKLVSVWKESRTFSGKIVDLLASVNIPVWYIYLFLGFLIPTLFLIFAIENTQENYLFKFNLVFAFLYVFLWLISSFWIVWYWITMYFSFFLMISIWASFIVSYKDSLNREKIIWTSAFLLIILSYVFFSLIPYIFSNLKTAYYNDFKKWLVTQSEAVFVHQPDYKTMIFTLNIDETKKEEFFKENIDSDIYNNYIANRNYNINQIFELLEYLEAKNDNDNAVKVSISKENLYKWMINPKSEFKDEWVVYRIWTFLLYYIYENNKRVFGDSLLFPFDDYIYSSNVSFTVDRLKVLWFKHLLIDLNSATIDSSLTHDLTNRYENLLKTLVSDKLKLVSTDSICLELGLELYRKNNDINQYVTVAWVNYDSYDENGNKIYRTEKKNICLNFIVNLIESDLVNDNDFTYLLPYKNYFEDKTLNINELNSVVWNSYRALFTID